MLYDSVLRLDDDGALVGGLAETWEAESASSYSFVIRDDATCADGTAITADVVAASLAYLADPETGSGFRSLVFGPGTADVTADGDTVNITLTEPYSDLERGLTIAQAGIICPAGLADLDGLAAGTVEGAFSGPYTLADAEPGLSYELALRADYDAWPSFAEPLTGTAPSRITYGLATDGSTTANQLLSGDLDFATVFGDTVDRFEGDSAFNITTTISAGVYITFNEQEGSVFAEDQPLRQAVARAIDREAYNTVLSDGRAPLYASVVSPSYECVNTDESLLEPYDPEAATPLLEGVTIRIVQSTAFGDDGAGGEYIQQALTEAGATVELQSTDNATWASTISTPGSAWDMTITGDINAAGVISASLDRVMGPSIADGGRSSGAADNPEGYAALKAGLATVDETERCAYFQVAQETMLERDDVVPLSGILGDNITREGVSIRAFGDYYDPATVRITD
ncbi:MAG: ABC transporter substrate-binding protein [Microbacterium sp.]